MNYEYLIAFLCEGNIGRGIVTIDKELNCAERIISLEEIFAEKNKLTDVHIFNYTLIRSFSDNEE